MIGSSGDRFTSKYYFIMSSHFTPLHHLLQSIQYIFRIEMSRRFFFLPVEHIMEKNTEDQSIILKEKEDWNVNFYRY